MCVLCRHFTKSAFHYKQKDARIHAFHNVVHNIYVVRARCKYRCTLYTGVAEAQICSRICTNGVQSKKSLLAGHKLHTIVQYCTILQPEQTICDQGRIFYKHV